MKFISFVSSIIKFTTLFATLFNATPILAATLSEEIKSSLAAYSKKVSFSVRNPAGQEVFQHRGDQSMAPASVAKIVSTACSLSALGPSYQFETIFSYRGQVTGDVLKGDLIISGNGDPSLVTEHLREIIEKIRVLYGIRKIDGDLIFDISYFNSEGLKISEGFEADAGRSFTTLLTPFPMNQNSFAVWAAPDLGSGQKARVSILPANVLDIRITNQVREAGNTQLSVSYQPQTRSAVVTGTVDRDGDLKGVYRAAPDTYDYYFRLIQKIWKDSGGEWSKGSYKTDRIVQNRKTLIKHQSKYLSQILMDVNKFSLNLGAELVFLGAGAKEGSLPATYEKSKNMFNRCLSEYGVSSEDISLMNASGLARDSKIKTSALSQFLYKYHESQFSSEYLASLSILGVDGTAKARLNQFAGRGRVKTGTLRDVRSIAGYIYDEKHRPYSFAMFFNDVSMGDPKIKATEDEILEKIFRKNFKFD